MWQKSSAALPPPWATTLCTQQVAYLKVPLITKATADCHKRLAINQ